MIFILIFVENYVLCMVFNIAENHTGNLENVKIFLNAIILPQKSNKVGTRTRLRMRRRSGDTAEFGGSERSTFLKSLFSGRS